MTAFSPPALQGLSDSLAARYADVYGAEALGPGAIFEDGVLTFSFTGGLREEEESLRGKDRMVELREAREAILAIVGTILVDPVQDFARATVGFHAELFDPLTSVSMMLFGLDPDEGGGEPGIDSRQLFFRSQAVRARARKLRREHVDAREAHIRIRAELRDLRLRLADLNDD
jgi:hypothetical protein